MAIPVPAPRAARWWWRSNCAGSCLALNGGPHQKLSEAFSLYVECTEQADIDRLWDALTDKPNVCGWTKDKFGLSWQIGYADLARP